MWVDGFCAPDTLRSRLSQHCAGRLTEVVLTPSCASWSRVLLTAHPLKLCWSLILAPAWPASWNSPQTNTFGDSLKGFKEPFPAATKEDVPAPWAVPQTRGRGATASLQPPSQLLTLTVQTPAGRKTAGNDPLFESGDQVFKKTKSTSRSKTTFICGWRHIRRYHPAEL